MFKFIRFLVIGNILAYIDVKWLFISQPSKRLVSVIYPADPAVEEARELVGSRVRITCRKIAHIGPTGILSKSTAHGSANLLKGLTATVVGAHPLVAGWVKIELDPNTVTSHSEWSVHMEALVCI